MQNSLKILRLTPVFFLVLVCVFALVLKCRIGLDLQEKQCLPYTVTIVRFIPPKAIERGQILSFVTSDHRIGHGMDGQMITKLVAGLPGDSVSIYQDQLSINGIKIGNKMDPLSLRHLGKKSGFYDRNFIIPQGEYFFIGTEPRAFDSRFWGTVRKSEVVAIDYPLTIFGGPPVDEYVHKSLSGLL